MTRFGIHTLVERYAQKARQLVPSMAKKCVSPHTIRFVVLKLRKVSGVESLSLRHPEMGSFAVPREWTDWEPPGNSSEPNTVQRSLLFDAAGALALAELVHALKRNNGA